MSTEATPTEITKKPSSLKFFVSTMLLVAIVMTAAQFLAIAIFGITGFVVVEAGYGPGLFAVIAGSVMAAKCRDWESWMKWVWIPISVGVALVFILTGLLAQAISNQQAQFAAELEEARSQAEICQSMRMELAITADEIEELERPRAWTGPGDPPSWYDPSRPSWADPPRAADIEAAKDRYEQLRSEYNASC